MARRRSEARRGSCWGVFSSADLELVMSSAKTAVSRAARSPLKQLDGLGAVAVERSVAHGAGPFGATGRLPPYATVPPTEHVAIVEDCINRLHEIHARAALDTYGTGARMDPERWLVMLATLEPEIPLLADNPRVVDLDSISDTLDPSRGRTKRRTTGEIW
jgi:hypothetical protein